jgi:hypothetical protein
LPRGARPSSSSWTLPDGFYDDLDGLDPGAALDAYLDEEPWAFPWTRPLLLFREAKTGLARTNVPRALAHHVSWRHAPFHQAGGEIVPLGPGASPYEFGPEGARTKEGLELALNALNLYVRPGSDGLAPRECAVVNVASATAFSLHERFAAEVLAGVSHRGAEIPYRRVAAWIEDRAPWLPPGFLPGER